MSQGGSWLFALIAAGVMASVAAAGCNKTGPDAKGLQAAPAGSEKATGTPFELRVSPPEEGKRGGPLVATVAVRPKGEYKINLEYPHKLTVVGPKAAAPNELTLTAKQAKLSKAELRFQPSFTVSSAGTHRFDGTVRFSVCTAKQCEIKAEKIHWVSKVAEQ